MNQISRSEAYSNFLESYKHWAATDAKKCRCQRHYYSFADLSQNELGPPLPDIHVCEREKLWRRYCHARDLLTKGEVSFIMRPTRSNTCH